MKRFGEKFKKILNFKSQSVRKLIEKQKEFYAYFFKDKKVDVNPELFEILAKNISSLFEYKKKNFLIKDGDLINLESPDVLKMEEKIKALTTKDLQDVAKKYLSKDKVIGILMPEN